MQGTIEELMRKQEENRRKQEENGRKLEEKGRKLEEIERKLEENWRKLEEQSLQTNKPKQQIEDQNKKHDKELTVRGQLVEDLQRE